VSRLRTDAAIAFSNSDAIIEGYQQRIVTAIQAARPALRFGVNVSLRPRPPGHDVRSEAVGSQPAPAPRGDPDYAVNVRVTTPMPLDDAQRVELMRAIQTSAGLDRSRGDAIAFLIGEPTPVDTSYSTPLASD